MSWLTWAAVKAFLRAIPWQVWAAALLALALWGLYTAGVHNGRAEVQAKFTAHLSADRGAEAVARQRARLKEEHDRAAFAQVASNYLEAKDEARRKGDALAAAVRAGRVRLRKEWSCPSGDLSGAAAGAQAADGNADLRAASAGRIVRIGAEADAQVKGLQELLKAERERPIPP